MFEVERGRKMTGEVLTGKVAIVTGGGQGIGEAISKRLAQEGAKVVIAEINPETSKKVVSEIKGKGQEAVAMQIDISKSADVRRLVDETLRRFGGIDILVNNAGVNKRTPFLDISEEEWDWVQGINLKGTLLCSQMVAREMVKAGKKGKIVNMSSIFVEMADPNQTNYSISKAGVYQLTMNMALELAPYGINVNAIGPGPIKTALTKHLVEDPEKYRLLLESIPLGRMGQPIDIANAVFFLVGPESDFITGHLLIVDGGKLIK
jgi:glucose 1-dehydrogenase